MRYETFKHLAEAAFDELDYEANFSVVDWCRKLRAAIDQIKDDHDETVED